MSAAVVETVAVEVGAVVAVVDAVLPLQQAQI